MTGQRHPDVGAYAIGALEHDEAERFEEHLAGCERCAAALAELVPVAGMLADVPPPQEPPPGALDRLLTELTAVRARQRRVRRRLIVAVTAAAVVAVAAPVVTAVVLTGDDPAPEQRRADVAGQEVRAVDPETGVEARISMRPVTWGTSVDLDLRGVSGPRRCDLQAVGKDGSHETVTSWGVPADGYGAGDGRNAGASGQGGGNSLRTSGGTSMSPDDIDHFEVVTSEGDRLVIVPAEAG
ncbi:zf-HC2 domain-containing protein [Streptomyces sp. NBC_01808]|uniref:zf-HC2 domain-containing protein n=1 Tax=Streptomyces sp. NBC_01808 TaxID=2975947 RepID=UPI002DDBE2A6|nr:zf-HC2 domain-containing protein [Streptomyces sp. NBC_01808]WSA38077.1 zf-HC2 domain-containing protein [Streptomyces sp. NBC_01808]